MFAGMSSSHRSLLRRAHRRAALDNNRACQSSASPGSHRIPPNCRGLVDGKYQRQAPTRISGRLRLNCGTGGSERVTGSNPHVAARPAAVRPAACCSMAASTPHVAEWASHSVDVLLRIYVKCVVGPRRARQAQNPRTAVPGLTALRSQRSPDQRGPDQDFERVELRRLELQTSCMPYQAKLSRTVADLARNLGRGQQNATMDRVRWCRRRVSETCGMPPRCELVPDWSMGVVGAGQ